MKQGILVVTQGSIHPVARRNVIDDFVGSILDRFEDAFVLCAFTSPEVRTFLRQRDGEKMRDIRASLLHMQMEGVTDVTVISTHVYENEGYLSMREQVSSCANIFKSIRMARPLLEDETDLDLFARAAHSAFAEDKKDSALVFFLSGEKTRGNDIFESLENKMRTHLGQDVFVSTLRGRMRMHTVLKNINGSKAVLVPLSFLNKGQIGKMEEEDLDAHQASLTSMSEAGLDVDELCMGLGEYDEFQRLYLRHLMEAMRD